MATIQITDKASSELASLLQGKGASGNEGLRLAVNKGGCAGWQYEMKVSAPATGDDVIEKNGVKVIVAADSIDKLMGCEIDYSDDLTDAGFKINNPKARRACGCGTSFEPDDEPEGSGVEDGEACGEGGSD